MIQTRKNEHKTEELIAHLIVFGTGLSFQSAWSQVPVCVSRARPSAVSLGVANGFQPMRCVYYHPGDRSSLGGRKLSAPCAVPPGCRHPGLPSFPVAVTDGCRCHMPPSSAWRSPCCCRETAVTCGCRRRAPSPPVAVTPGCCHPELPSPPVAVTLGCRHPRLPSPAGAVSTCLPRTCRSR